MRSKIFLALTQLSFVAALGMAQPAVRYQLTDLGPKGNPFSLGSNVNNSGVIAGSVTEDNGSSHAVVWLDGVMTDIGKPGLAGPNSSAAMVNLRGQVLMQGETTKDPNNENFCGLGDGLVCAVYLWQYGAIAQLPTLGGPNAAWGGFNNLGQVAGYAERATGHPGCPTTKAVNGNGPQILDFEPVVWGPSPTQIRALPLLRGDTVGIAMWINDSGEAVGVSGQCGNTVLPGFVAGPHAVVWETDGSVHDLGNLGGTVNPTLLGVGNAAMAINNRGQIAGLSALTGDKTFHPFLWTKEYGMRDLGVLPGDLVGASLAINNRGEVVGTSVSAPGPASGDLRAFLWRDGVMDDLNDLVQANAPLYLLQACSINDSGEIVGMGATADGEVHAFLATPIAVDSNGGSFTPGGHHMAAPYLSEKARKLAFGWRGMRGR